MSECVKLVCEVGGVCLSPEEAVCISAAGDAPTSGKAGAGRAGALGRAGSQWPLLEPERARQTGLSQR